MNLCHPCVSTGIRSVIQAVTSNIKESFLGVQDATKNLRLEKEGKTLREEEHVFSFKAKAHEHRQLVLALNLAYLEVKKHSHRL